PHEVFASTTWAFPRCSAHGQCVLFEQRGDQMIISSLDAVRGKGGELAAVPLIRPGEALLADGNRVAFIIEDARPRNHIRVVSLRGGPTRDIVVDKATALMGLDATPDGSGLF